MNRSSSTYCPSASTATYSGTFVGFASSGKDPRQGWRTPLNNIKYSEQRDEETGLSYFGAMYYDADLLTGWPSVDPMIDKYPSTSTYNYCSLNPIKMIDPDGMDDWEVSSTGKVRRLAENKEKDVVFSLNKKGERVNSIEFRHGTIENLSSGKGRGYNYQVLRVRGDENGQNLFEFLANPDNYELLEGHNVEWSRILAGKAGECGLNFLTTSWEKDRDGGSHSLFFEQLKFGYTIRGMDHNHPNNNPNPSGTGGGNGDILFLKTLRTVGVCLAPNAKFRIYTPGNMKKYHNYNDDSKIELPTFTIYGSK